MAELGLSDFPCLVWPHSFTILLFLQKTIGKTKRLGQTRFSWRKRVQTAFTSVKLTACPCLWDTGVIVYALSAFLSSKHRNLLVHLSWWTLMEGQSVWCFWKVRLCRSFTDLWAIMQYLWTTLGAIHHKPEWFFFFRAAFHQHSQNWPHKFPISVYKSSSKQASRLFTSLHRSSHINLPLATSWDLQP